MMIHGIAPQEVESVVNTDLVLSSIAFVNRSLRSNYSAAPVMPGGDR